MDRPGLVRAQPIVRPEACRRDPLTRAGPPTRLPRASPAKGAAVIRLGIVGCNYGRTVLLPAFRLDPRCEVVALAGTDAARTAALARQAGVPQAFGDWTAAGGARRPSTRSRSRRRRGCSPRSRSVRSRSASRCSPKSRWRPTSPAPPPCCARPATLPTMIDFSFTEVPAWRTAKAHARSRRDRTASPRRSHLERRERLDPAAAQELEDQRRRRRRRARQSRQPFDALSRMVLRADRAAVGATVRAARRSRVRDRRYGRRSRFRPAPPAATP